MRITSYNFEIAEEILSQLRFGRGSDIHLSWYEEWQSLSGRGGNGSHSGNNKSSIQGS